MTEPEHAGVAAVAQNVIRLGREVESLRRLTETQRTRLTDVTSDVDQDRATLGALAVTVAGLAEQLAELTAAEDEAGQGTRSWFDQDDTERAATLLADLADWSGRVFLRYPGASLPTCWLWHPAVVEELLLCRRAWQDAYHGDDASTFRAVDWHDRTRPGVVSRIVQYAGTCALDQHAPNAPQDVLPGRAPLARSDSARGIVADAWTANPAGATPYPTADHLAEVSL